MAPSYPSIQSFYKREVPSSPTKERLNSDGSSANAKERGDGFTEKELTESLDPFSRKWTPPREYEELPINELAPGPKPVCFTGRVVNFTTVHGKSPKQPRARGWCYLLVRDDGGLASVKLYFAQDPYPLRLGQLLSIWTAFISSAPKEDTMPLANVSAYANLFPGRNTSDHVMVLSHRGSDNVCRLPLEYKRGEPLSGIMTLHSWIDGGWDGVVGAKILVAVKSMGAKKSVRRKDDSMSELLEVQLWDHTGEVRFKFWGEMIESARTWIPGKTILLVTNPVHRLEYRGQVAVSLGRNSWVDVQPEGEDAQWLRRWVAGTRRKEAVGGRVPDGVFDVEAAILGPRPALFKLADIDEWIRDDPRQTFTGFISVIFLNIALVSNYRKNMLMCAECCGIPLYSNTTPHPCPHCTKPSQLTLNPRILGTLIDETGALQGGKLLWTEEAWKDLMGRKAADVGRMRIEDVRMLEMRLQGLRGSLCFGWVGEGGEWGLDDDVGGAGAGGGDKGLEKNGGTCGNAGGGVERDGDAEVTGGRLCILGMRS